MSIAMKRSFTVFLVSALVSLSASANERLFLQVPALVDPSAPYPPAVKNECGVEMLLGNYALSAIGRRGSVQPVATPEQAGADKLVQLTILSVHGAGGGAWSGSKSMSIRADIKKAGTTVGSTVFTRNSGGGPFGGFVGTCAILDRVAGALGRDVAAWLSREAAPRPINQVASTAEPPAESESSATK